MLTYVSCRSALSGLLYGQQLQMQQCTQRILGYESLTALLHLLIVCMQVGSDDDGYAVRMRFEHFLRYCAYQHHAGSDDSPLYIFDGTFADRSGSAAMAKQYSVPGLFKEDLFQLAGERRRPPYRCVSCYLGCYWAAVRRPTLVLVRSSPAG
jgi:hypothetical protein